MRNFQCPARVFLLAVASVLSWSVLFGCSSSGQLGGRDGVTPDSTSAIPLSSRPTTGSQAEFSQAALDKAVKAGEPGCSAAVERRGTILWSGVAGVSNLQRRDPITPETVFDIGSVSKQFTATAVLLLQQEGKLSVNDRLSHHLDGLPGWADQVTLAQLMHHVSGIPVVEDALIAKGSDQDRVNRTTLRKAISEIERLDFRPGKRLPYSNANYFLRAEVVEQESGQPFATYLRTRIFEPLQLKMSVGYHDPIPGKAISYRYDNLNEPQVADWHWMASPSVPALSKPPQPSWSFGPTTIAAAQSAAFRLQQAQLAGARSTTLGKSNPSQSEVYGAGVVKTTDGHLFTTASMAASRPGLGSPRTAAPR